MRYRLLLGRQALTQLANARLKAAMGRDAAARRIASLGLAALRDARLRRPGAKLHAVPDDPRQAGVRVRHQRREPTPWPAIDVDRLVLHHLAAGVSNGR